MNKFRLLLGRISTVGDDVVVSVDVLLENLALVELSTLFVLTFPLPVLCY